MGQNLSYLNTLVSVPIKLYQYLLGPSIRPCCRFYPSCSQYALDAVEQFGAGKGIWKACCRLLRCHPWSLGGYDPILPENKEKY